MDLLGHVDVGGAPLRRRATARFSCHQRYSSISTSKAVNPTKQIAMTRYMRWPLPDRLPAPHPTAIGQQKPQISSQGSVRVQGRGHRAWRPLPGGPGHQPGAAGTIRQRVHFPQRSDRLACTRPWAHRLRLGGAGKRSTGSEEDVSDLRGEPFTVPVDDHAFGALRIGLGGG